MDRKDLLRLDGPQPAEIVAAAVQVDVVGIKDEADVVLVHGADDPVGGGNVPHAAFRQADQLKAEPDAAGPRQGRQLFQDADAVLLRGVRVAGEHAARVERGHHDDIPAADGAAGLAGQPKVLHRGLVPAGGPVHGHPLPEIDGVDGMGLQPVGVEEGAQLLCRVPLQVAAQHIQPYLDVIEARLLAQGKVLLQGGAVAAAGLIVRRFHNSSFAQIQVRGKRMTSLVRVLR